MELSDEELDAVAGGKGSTPRDDSYYHNQDQYTCVGIEVSGGIYSYQGTTITRDSASALAYYLRQARPDTTGLTASQIQQDAFSYVSTNWQAYADDRKHANGG